MSFWNLFKNIVGDDCHNSIHTELKKVFKGSFDDSQDSLTIAACVAGLMARVAYQDLDICESEKEYMVKALEKWMHFSSFEREAIANIAISEMEKLSGVENHLYCGPLNEILTQEQKISLIDSLFELASSDGGVDNKESEEIKLITRELLLENKHYLSSRAKVIQYLNVLK